MAATAPEPQEVALVRSLLAELLLNWGLWRETSSVRAVAPIVRTKTPRSQKQAQLPWHSYVATQRGEATLFEECLLVPFLVLVGDGATQSLTGAPKEAELQTTVIYDPSMRSATHTSIGWPIWHRSIRW